MRGRMPISLMAMLLGAVETGGGVQELVYLGVLNSQTEAMIVGSLGTVGGALLLAAGIALLLDSPRTRLLVEASAYVSVPVFLFIGVIKHYAAWPITIVGMIYPVLMLVYCRLAGRREGAAAKM